MKEKWEWTGAKIAKDYLVIFISDLFLYGPHSNLEVTNLGFKNEHNHTNYNKIRFYAAHMRVRTDTRGQLNKRTAYALLSQKIWKF
jgi:hypothetical protein